MMRYVQVALWRHPINGRASAKPSGVVFVVLDDVSVAVLRVIMSLSDSAALQISLCGCQLGAECLVSAVGRR